MARRIGAGVAFQKVSQRRLSRLNESTQRNGVNDTHERMRSIGNKAISRRLDARDAYLDEIGRLRPHRLSLARAHRVYSKHVIVCSIHTSAIDWRGGTCAQTRRAAYDGAHARVLTTRDPDPIPRKRVSLTDMSEMKKVHDTNRLETRKDFIDKQRGASRHSSRSPDIDHDVHANLNIPQSKSEDRPATRRRSYDVLSERTRAYRAGLVVATGE